MKISLNRVALNFILIGPPLLCKGEISWCLNSQCAESSTLWSLILAHIWLCQRHECEDAEQRGGLGHKHPSWQCRLHAGCEGSTSRIGLVCKCAGGNLIKLLFLSTESPSLLRASRRARLKRRRRFVLQGTLMTAKPRPMGSVWDPKLLCLLALGDTNGRDWLKNVCLVWDGQLVVNGAGFPYQLRF